MARLYKMTLYVCDLEESLSLDEIEVLIGEQALDSVSVSAICHFADEQIGERVEWDDDIDLNRCGCPTSTWEKYFTPPKKPQTNADRIRAMSDEELAAFLDTWGCCHHCIEHERLSDNRWFSDERCDEKCVKHCLEWLKQPADMRETNQ